MEQVGNLFETMPIQTGRNFIQRICLHLALTHKLDFLLKTTDKSNAFMDSLTLRHLVKYQWWAGTPHELN